MPRTKLPPAAVQESLSALAGWTLQGEDAITKQFILEDHITALGFVVRVATAAEVMDHHPDIHWAYNRVRFTLSTHDAGGLTKNDFELAARIEALK